MTNGCANCGSNIRCTASNWPTKWNAHTISIQPGGPMIGATIDRQTAERRFANGLERLLPLAERIGITIADRTRTGPAHPNRR